MSHVFRITLYIYSTEFKPKEKKLLDHAFHMSLFAAEANKQWAERQDAVAAAGGEREYLTALRIQKAFDAQRAARQAAAAMRQQEQLAEARQAKQAEQAVSALSADAARLSLTRVYIVGLEPRQPGETTPQYKARVKEHMRMKRQQKNTFNAAPE